MCGAVGGRKNGGNPQKLNTAKHFSQSSFYIRNHCSPYLWKGNVLSQQDSKQAGELASHFPGGKLRFWEGT